ncbi:MULTISPECIES: type II toxin-antitoxin system RelE/ParE family toxin [Acidiphilium]|uniref:type II toxin-antitoxin system RelE/ParE family toxin n=1 Tax=Acidiphilium TaxID=522 RepID=UPI0002DB887A|nr:MULTISPECIES: type II toxin-antitoxin system RelE/ParE family toxin [Acidiphilium]
MPVIFTAEAINDLVHIRHHIGRENPAAATRIAVQLVAACDRLEYLPERGRPGLVSGTRELTVIWPYIIVYRIVGQNAEVLRIWHGAQDRREF